MFDKRLLALLGKDKKYVIYIVICNLLTTVINVVFAFSLCFIFDYLYKGYHELTDFSVPLIIAIGALLIRFILSRIAGHAQANLGTNAKSMLRDKIYQKVARLGVRETGDLSLASLTQVGVEDVEQLDLYYSTYIPQFFYSVISPFLLFILLMFISKPSAIILIACVPLIPMSIIAVSKYAKKIFAKYWGQYTKMGDAFLDNISGMKELKIYNADQMYHEKMNSEADAFRKITMKVLTMQLASTTIMDLVAYGGAGAGIAIAVANQATINPLFNLSVPALLLFIVLVAVDFFLPLRALGSAFHVSMNGATAGKKILALLDTPEPIWGDKKVGDIKLSLKDVSFSYDSPDSDVQKMILNHVNLTLNKGQTLAIVGQSGSGKSTIVSLLSGTLQNYQGDILMGDTPLKELDRTDFYKHVGIVSYNTYIFNDSVRNNFKIAKNDVTDEEIKEALKKVNLTDAITDLDMIIKEDSTNISGGQRQRLALAINLVADKDIYLFDEITSNIDSDSEAIIMDNIFKMKDKAILIISHRLRNVERCDDIIYLEGGTFVEEGTHQELMSKDSHYKALLTTQIALEDGYKEVA